MTVEEIARKASWAAGRDPDQCEQGAHNWTHFEPFAAEIHALFQARVEAEANVDEKARSIIRRAADLVGDPETYGAGKLQYANAEVETLRAQLLTLTEDRRIAVKELEKIAEIEIPSIVSREALHRCITFIVECARSTLTEIERLTTSQKERTK